MNGISLLKCYFWPEKRDEKKLPLCPSLAIELAINRRSSHVLKIGYIWKFFAALAFFRRQFLGSSCNRSWTLTSADLSSTKYTKNNNWRKKNAAQNSYHNRLFKWFCTVFAFLCAFFSSISNFINFRFRFVVGFKSALRMSAMKCRQAIFTFIHRMW